MLENLLVATVDRLPFDGSLSLVAAACSAAVRPFPEILTWTFSNCPR